MPGRLPAAGVAVANLRAAWWLTRDVTLASLRQHWLRSLLTLIGVVIGAQVVVAIAVLNRSILASFAQTVETIAGSADLQVANGSAGVPEELAMTLESVSGVASAAGLIRGTLKTDFGDVTVFGVDLFADQGIRETQFPKKYVHIKEPVAFANVPDSIALSTSLADRAGLRIGSAFVGRGPTGHSTLTVRGLLDPIGPAALFGGDVALVDLPTAQHLFAREGLFDQVDIALEDGKAPPDVIERLKTAVGGAGTIEPPREHAVALGTMLSGVQTILTLVSLFAVVVGAFIVYHTMETAIAHRQREFALARALGYRRRVLLTAIGLEALVYGLAGTVVGTTLGIAGARLSFALVTGGMAAIWGRLGTASLALTPFDVGVAAACGVGSAFVASLAPALAAARAPIIEQLRDQRHEVPHARDYGVAIRGGVLALAGYAILDSGVRPGSFASTIVVIMAGVILLAIGYTYATPFLLGLVIDALRHLSARARPAAPPLALENIARDPRRYRGTIAALMAAFAMVLIVSSFVRSLRGSILSWLDQTLSAEFYVSAGPHLPLPSGPTIDGAVEPDLRALPGVADVSASRLINVRVGDTLAILRSVSVGGLERHRYPVVEGDMRATVAAFAQGDAVLVSDNFAYRHGFHAGDSLTLSTPSGERTFRIAAVVLDYTLDIGTILIERDTYVRLWRDELVNGFLVWLVPGTDAESARAAISRLLGSRFDATILTAREFNAQLADVLDRALLITYAVQMVAITIAVIGVVNFFLAEVLDRTREIGLLRSVALTRRQLVRTISVEAMLLGAFGGAMAALYAWPVARLLVTRSTRVVSGWALTFDFPVGLGLVTVAIAALTSVAAAYYPAHRVAGRRVADLVLVES